MQAAVENLSARPAVTCTGALLAGIHRTRAGRIVEGSGRRPRTPRGARAARGPRRSASFFTAGSLWAGIVLVVAPYLGYRAFACSRRRSPSRGMVRGRRVVEPVAARLPRRARGGGPRGTDAGSRDLTAGFGAIEEARRPPVEPAVSAHPGAFARAALARAEEAPTGCAWRTRLPAAAALDPCILRRTSSGADARRRDPETALRRRTQPRPSRTVRSASPARGRAGRPGSGRRSAVRGGRGATAPRGNVRVVLQPYEAQVLRCEGGPSAPCAPNDDARRPRPPLAPTDSTGASAYSLSRRPGPAPLKPRVRARNGPKFEPGP
jgi:hypothetical protein